MCMCVCVCVCVSVFMLVCWMCVWVYVHICVCVCMWMWLCSWLCVCVCVCVCECIYVHMLGVCVCVGGVLELDACFSLVGMKQRRKSFVRKTSCCMIVFLSQIHTGTGSRSQGGTFGVYRHEIQGWHPHESHSSTPWSSSVITSLLTLNESHPSTPWSLSVIASLLTLNANWWINCNTVKLSV